MPCPICEHTVQCVRVQPRTFWCPKCGTIINGDVGPERTFQAPKITEKFPFDDNSNKNVKMLRAILEELLDDYLLNIEDTEHNPQLIGKAEKALKQTRE